MTPDVTIAGVALVLAAWPALMYLRNLRSYRPPPLRDPARRLDTPWPKLQRPR